MSTINEGASAFSEGSDQAAPIPAVGARPVDRARPLFDRDSRELRIAVAGSEEVAAAGASRSRDALYRRSLALADVVAAAAAFAVAVPVLGDDSLRAWSLVAIAMVVPLCKAFGLYDRDEHLVHKTTLDEAPTLFSMATLYTLLVLLAGDGLVDGSFGREQAVFFWAFLFVALVLSRALSRRLVSAWAAEERCVIIGNADAAAWLAAKLERSQGTTVQVVGRVPLSPADVGGGAVPVLGQYGALEPLLADRAIDRVLIAPGRSESADHRMLDLVRIVKQLDVEVTVLPRLFEVLGPAFEVDDVEGTTLLGVRRHGLGRTSRIVKRGFDLLCAFAGMVILAPVVALIAVAIKLDSPGPVFFRQRRVGQDDAIFEIYKFRTMFDGADSQRSEISSRNEAAGGLFKIEDDPRITRVGRFLRRTALDELPQLLNVLRGEMSLVGPRPLVIEEDCLIEGLHRHRLIVPPGITGLWQVFGSARIPMGEMAKIDYLYGASWSVWLDLKILLRTIPFALARRGL